MKHRISARHVIPTVCYAVLFAASVVFLISVTTSDIVAGEIPQNSGIAGLLALSLMAVAIFVLVAAGIGSALMSLFPLLFSSINLRKRNRKLTTACLVFDALLVQYYLVGFCSTLSSADGATLPLAFASALGLSMLALIMNILNIKRNTPVEITVEQPAEREEVTTV